MKMKHEKLYKQEVYHGQVAPRLHPSLLAREQQRCIARHAMNGEHAFIVKRKKALSNKYLKLPVLESNLQQKGDSAFRVSSVLDSLLPLCLEIS